MCVCVCVCVCLSIEFHRFTKNHQTVQPRERASAEQEPCVALVSPHSTLFFVCVFKLLKR